MEKLNTEMHELSIDELDAVSGGALYQPVIVRAVVLAVEVKEVLKHVVDRVSSWF
jgi:bacteriocin-like protein